MKRVLASTSVLLAALLLGSGAWGKVTTSFVLDGPAGLEVASFPAAGANAPSGNLTLSTLPAGADVVKATLYAGNFFQSAITPSAVFDGASLGSTSAFDADANFSAYQWDVTGLIPGNGTYTASASGLTNNYGLTLVVVYTHPSLPTSRVVINDGASEVFAPDNEITFFSTVFAGQGELFIRTSADNNGGIGQTDEEISFNGAFVAGPIDGNLGDSASLFQIPVTAADFNRADISTLGDDFGWLVAALRVGRVAGGVLLRDGSPAGGAGGYGVPGSSTITGLLDAATSNQVTVVDDYTDNALVQSFDALWVNTADRSGSMNLTAAEIANVQEFISSGKRVVLFGENFSWASWNDSILSTVGGSPSGSVDGVITTVLAHPLTAGVASIRIPSGTTAGGGTALFSANVATLWGAGNTLSVLDSNALDDAFIGSNDNLQFGQNLVNWVADTVTVVIDIKPNDAMNHVNPAARRKIPVAILGSAEFDVTDVVLDSLAFGPAGGARFRWAPESLEDVSGDGIDDLVVYFLIEESGIAMGAEEACLSGETEGGGTFDACDEITTVPSCGLGWELVMILPPLVWLRTRRRRSASAARRC